MNRPLPRVLLADDDHAFRLAMGKALGRLGFPIAEASSGEEAIAALRENRTDVALLDLQLGDLDGIEVLRRARGTKTRVIVVTGHGTISAAVDAMRLGAVNFVQKPVDAPALLPLLEDAAAEGGIGAPVQPSRRGDGNDLGLAGESEELERVRELIRRAGPTDETVLVTGESGVGKELVARALHACSERASRPFVAFNCAQAHRDLFDAELFGYVKGAFTGASNDRAGLFREADGGTLFLDEVGELPEGAQAKLLRALETHAVRPVGGSREERVDARVIAATNRDLAEEVRAGRFREDLFYRLHVLSVSVPPLRSRRDDLAPIARAILSRCAGGRLVLEPAAVAELERYDWPGNVRELANVLKRAAIFSTGSELTAAEVRDAIGASIFGHPEARAARITPAAPAAAPVGDAASDVTLADLEKRHILETFERMGGNVTRVAQALGIDRRTLQRKLKGFGRDTGED